MSATERLREMLNERGIEWWPNDDPRLEDIITNWCVGPFQWTAIEGEKDLWLNAGIAGHEPLTPEQAIAATVGVGTCHDVCASASEFTCSACGFNCDLVSWTSLFDGDEGRHRHHHHGTPNYCPNCGRKVVGA